MKFKLWLLFLVTGFSSCKTGQLNILEATSDNGLEPGAFYFLIMLEEGGIKEEPFILEIVPPALEKHEPTIIIMS